MRRPVQWPFPLAFVLAISACAPAAAPAPATAPAAPDAAVAAGPITAEAMRARIAFIASDALRGRDTPSQGLEAAAKYLASEAERMGLRPAGEHGTYLQRYPFPIRRMAVDRARVSFAGAGATQALRYGRDFFTIGGTIAEIDGGLVYAGRGLPSDPAVLEGALRDQVALVALPGPLGGDWAALQTAQTQAAEAGGARAIIHILDPVWGEAQIAQLAAQAARPVRTLGDALGFPSFLISHEAARRLFTAAQLDLSEAWQRATVGELPPLALPGITVLAAAPEEVLERADPPNVVAMIPGSDPVLRDEYVILTAHFDHVGVGPPVRGDSIYNGADDNGSGTAALLEIARILAARPNAPRRSVVFLWVSGEEKGLLGSLWYTENPTVPLERVVANLNLDMIAQNAPDTVVVIGKEYSTLGELVDSVSAHHRELNLVAADDLWPEQGLFTRSDHFNFARNEIPAVMFFTGLHECYHRPCDTLDFIIPDKAARVATLVYHTTLAIANAEQRPAWHPAGLEAVRRWRR